MLYAFWYEMFLLEKAKRYSLYCVKPHPRSFKLWLLEHGGGRQVTDSACYTPVHCHLWFKNELWTVITPAGTPSRRSCLP